jgi:hypothetical protein
MFELGNVYGQLFYTNCDKYYHTQYLILDSDHDVQKGWCCLACRIRQTSRQLDNNAKMIVWNVRDKGFDVINLYQMMLEIIQVLYHNQL